MTRFRELEQPLRAWRAFKEIAHATRTLAAARAMHWAEMVRHADAHVALCQGFARQLPARASTPSARVLLALGTDLGLCGSLNREVARRAAEVREPAIRQRILVGTRLAGLEPLPGALVLSSPSSFEAIELLATEIEDLCARVSDPFEYELMIVVADAIEEDGRPCVALRHAGDQPRDPDARALVLGDLDVVQRQALLLGRHARLVAALTRALASEHEARWRTMSRAYEAANRRIAEQEQTLRKLGQELITQEMLEARRGARRPPVQPGAAILRYGRA